MSCVIRAACGHLRPVAAFPQVDRVILTLHRACMWWASWRLGSEAVTFLRRAMSTACGDPMLYFADGVRPRQSDVHRAAVGPPWQPCCVTHIGEA